MITEVLAVAERWTGEGWNTTKAAKAVRSLTGVALVSSKFSDYLGAFLYSLSLQAGVEIQCVDLSDKAAYAAFVLADLWAAHLEGDETEEPRPAAVPAGSAAKAPATEKDEEEDAEGEQYRGYPGKPLWKPSQSIYKFVYGDCARESGCKQR